MQLIWHGTASVEIAGPAGRVLFDPFVPLKHSKVNVKIEDFDGFSDILITHGHFDHIASIPQIVKRNQEVTVHCTGTPYQTLVRKGIPEKNLDQIAFGQTLHLAGLSLTVLHGRHAVLPRVTLARAACALRSSARGNLRPIARENKVCRENGETVFYQIEGDGKTVSLMGSMNLRDDIDYPVGSDLLVLPYNGWEDNYPPAVRIIERLKPKRVLLDHYDDTFPPLTSQLDFSPILERYEGRIAPLELGKAEEV